MRSALALSLALGFAALSIVACKHQDETPAPTAPSAAPTGYATPGYNGQPGQPTQPGYNGQPAYTAAPTGYATAPTAAPLSAPGPMATACQSDSQCLSAKCNTQYGKCVFPCAVDTDCNPGNYCFKGAPMPACVPKLGN